MRFGDALHKLELRKRPGEDGLVGDTADLESSALRLVEINLISGDRWLPFAAKCMSSFSAFSSAPRI